VQVLASAALVAVAGIAVVVRLPHHQVPAAASPLAVRPAASTTAAPLPAVPDQDLAGASLSGAAALVTPFQMIANDGTGTTLIGAYADATRTVLFFRGAPVQQPGGPSVDISVYDSQGFLNGGSMEGRGIAGDSSFSLDLGPRSDPDGLAHLTVTDTYPQEPFTAPPPTTGWAYRFSLKVAGSTPLEAPGTFPLGSWKVTVESLAVTPATINFQAVIAGANNQQLFNNIQSQPIVLLDAAGNEVHQISGSAGVTVPKQQLNATTYQNTRVHFQWARPPTAVTYRLRLTGNGATQTITLQIPAP